jgi:hemerythrin-like domain-containing protein
MNAIRFLKQEHQTAKAAFEKVLRASPEERGDLWDELAPELKAHEQMEDACLYKPLSQNGKGQDQEVLTGWRQEHQGEVKKVEALMREIDHLDSEDAKWLETVTKVHTSLTTHIEEEEGKIFPRIGKVWDETRLEQAGTDMEKMKSGKAGAA